MPRRMLLHLLPNSSASSINLGGPWHDTHRGPSNSNGTAGTRPSIPLPPSRPTRGAPKPPALSMRQPARAR